MFGFLKRIKQTVAESKSPEEAKAKLQFKGGEVKIHRGHKANEYLLARAETRLGSLRGRLVRNRRRFEQGVITAEVAEFVEKETEAAIKLYEAQRDFSRQMLEHGKS